MIGICKYAGSNLFAGNNHKTSSAVQGDGASNFNLSAPLAMKSQILFAQHNCMHKCFLWVCVLPRMETILASVVVIIISVSKFLEMDNTLNFSDLFAQKKVVFSFLRFQGNNDTTYAIFLNSVRFILNSFYLQVH